MNNQEEAPSKSSMPLPPTVRLDGSKVRKIREAKGLTQLYVATSVGVTTDTISRWENRRYPTVKRENVLKLADTLDVDVCDILEDTEKDQLKAYKEAGGEGISCSCEEKTDLSNAGGPGEKPPGDGYGSTQKIWIFLGFVVLLSLVSVAGLYVFLRPHGEFLEITATRFLPEHSAPGQTFPVIIDVYVKPEKQRTLLLKDGASQGIEFLRGIPAFTSNGQHFIKWIHQGKFGYIKFIYLARINARADRGETFHFSGEITIKEQKKKPFPLDGNRIIRTMSYNWADINRDHIIDDEEILEAYDLLSGVKEADKTLREVQSLWSAGGYMWDINENRFRPVQNKRIEKRQSKTKDDLN